MGNNSMIQGDSIDYEVITYAIDAIPKELTGMTCEVGLRMGQGTKYILDALASRGHYKVHVGLDPYGQLMYDWLEGTTVRLDYTNSMRDGIIGEIYKYAMSKQVNFIFMNLTDVEFFKRFPDGVPVYEQEESLITDYIFVHFDGPHHLDKLQVEFLWFNDRMKSGSTIVFDDVTFYDFEAMHPFVKSKGWKPILFTQKKVAYQKL